MGALCIRTQCFLLGDDSSIITRYLNPLITSSYYKNTIRQELFSFSIYYIKYQIQAVGRIFVGRIFVGRIFVGRNLALLPFLYTSLRLIISKILRAKSPFSSLSPLYYSDIVALLYKKLDIGSWSVLIAISPYCLTAIPYILLYV